MKYFTAVVAMLGLICAAGLDSEQWKIPFIVMIVCAVWCIIYGIFLWRPEDETEF